MACAMQAKLHLRRNAESNLILQYYSKTVVQYTVLSDILLDFEVLRCDFTLVTELLQRLCLYSLRIS